MLRAKWHVGLVSAAASLAVICTVQAQQPGVTDAEIRIGGTFPYSGPYAAYGTLGNIFTAFFEMVNAPVDEGGQGGIDGRKIVFVAHDDAFNIAGDTLAETRRLAEVDDVLLIFGTTGDNPNLAAREYLNNEEIPQLFISANGANLNDPEHFPWTIRWQPSPFDEAVVYGEYILGHFPGEKIGILYEVSTWGQDYLDGLADALNVEDILDEEGNQNIVTRVYDATDPNVDAQIVALRDAGATVLVNLATPRIAALAIKRAAEIGWSPQIFLAVISANVRTVLGPAGVDNATGLISALYIKDPANEAWENDPDIDALKRFVRDYYPEGDVGGTFEAYAFGAASALVEVLRLAGDDLSRENIMTIAKNLNDMPVPLLLAPVSTSPTDYLPIEFYQLARFNGEAFIPIGPIIDFAERRPNN